MRPNLFIYLLLNFLFVIQFYALRSTIPLPLQHGGGTGIGFGRQQVDVDQIRDKAREHNRALHQTRSKAPGEPLPQTSEANELPPCSTHQLESAW
jgi:hypothetical protein